MQSVISPSPSPSQSTSVLPLSQWPDPRKLTRQSDIAQQVIALTARENELSVELNNIISNRSNLDDSTARLAALVPKIKSLGYEVNGRRDTTLKDPTTILFSPGSRRVYNENGEDEDDYTHDLDGDGDDDDDGLVERVNRVWITSERVGGKVRKLDVEVSRVKEALDRVNDVVELKVSSIHERLYDVLSTLTTFYA